MKTEDSKNFLKKILVSLKGYFEKSEHPWATHTWYDSGAVDYFKISPFPTGPTHPPDLHYEVMLYSGSAGYELRNMGFDLHQEGSLEERSKFNLFVKRNIDSWKNWSTTTWNIGLKDKDSSSGNRKIVPSAKIKFRPAKLEFDEVISRLAAMMEDAYTTIQPKLEKEYLVFNSMEEAFSKYLEICENTNWLQDHESYKFKFGRWLNEKVDFQNQSDQEIFDICLESQEQVYGIDSTKGVNFILADLRYNDHFITLGDVRVFRRINNGEGVTKELLKEVTMSAPKFSIWVGCLFPGKFRIYAKQDWEGARKVLNIPEKLKKGISGFVQAQEGFLPLFNLVKNQKKELVKVLEKVRLGGGARPVDLNWFTQDFSFFVEKKGVQIINLFKKKPMPQNIPLNQILFGPPGTGKTYSLQNETFPDYTDFELAQTREDFLIESVSKMKWWEAIAAAMMQIGKSVSVSELMSNEIITIRHNASETKNLRAGLWGQLQMHTASACENVNYAYRNPPLIFWKNEDKTWGFDGDYEVDQYGELKEFVERLENFKQVETSRKRYKFLTFHQSYAYEDFVEGIKPIMDSEKDDGMGGEISYDFKNGKFYDACLESLKLAGYMNFKECLEDSRGNRADKFRQAPTYALVIDEINRGNVSQVFGELITLLEIDKRLGAENEITDTILPYSGRRFGVPANLHIIATMNTADRSVEALDTALRRRFTFKEMPPKSSLLAKMSFQGIDLVKMLQTMNERIEKLIDKDHCLGHSFFMKIDSAEDRLTTLKDIFSQKIIPQLQEYFFGDFGKIGLVIGKAFVREKTTQSLGSKDFFADFKYSQDVKNDLFERKVWEITEREKWSVEAFIRIYDSKFTSTQPES